MFSNDELVFINIIQHITYKNLKFVNSYLKTIQNHK